MKCKLFIITTLFLQLLFLDSSKAQLFNTFYLTAQNHLQNRNYQEAIDFSTKAIKSRQSAEKAKFIRAEAYYELAIYNKAKEDIFDIIDNNNNNNNDSNKYILSLKILDKLGLYKELKEKSLIYFEKCKSNTLFSFYVMHSRERIQSIT
jgi:tetratricopeptide (TPR) repeat protein